MKAIKTNPDTSTTTKQGTPPANTGIMLARLFSSNTTAATTSSNNNKIKTLHIHEVEVAEGITAILEHLAIVAKQLTSHFPFTAKEKDNNLDKKIKEI